MILYLNLLLMILLNDHRYFIIVLAGFLLLLPLEHLLAPLGTPLWFGKIFLELFLPAKYFRLVCLALCDNFVENAIVTEAPIVVLDCRPDKFVFMAQLYIRLF